MALIILLFFILILVALYVWRLSDHWSDRIEEKRLLKKQPIKPPRFSYDMVETLPEPAKRFFRFAIKEGATLQKVTKISMHGQFGMGDKNTPNYLPMKAEQIVTVPKGFIWRMSAGSGVMKISGSDSGNWTRFWLAGLLPVARAGGTIDHTLSAFGRNIAEAIIWAPSAVLPASNIIWEAIDANTARLIVIHNELKQSVDVTVDAEGRPILVKMDRWSNANANGTFQYQPFGGYLSKFRNFDGFCLPTHVEAGNMIETSDYFPFFIVDVSKISFF
ncbi:DUF6544 family protein [Kordiimonas sp. SCSIO 12610]|uniref:DUF6544 family protein n=1 Tax=Kordiimonas sp. SCSIO 12610 TaxID=2829597 RepID=UPI00210BE639|nr:DUF6544 family protein [Kordiimonas sp. SCSIO 12610]UTW54608.1 hypothetical protein KFF44_12460 [Kordiimonas sp. SCSIO 12610]